MRRRSTDDRHERTHDYDLCTDDELEVLSPLPLRMAREAIVLDLGMSLENMYRDECMTEKCLLLFLQ
jgi:hypothetical protein